MKVLHINSFFFSNRLHYQLVKKISERGINQEVYIPVDSSDPQRNMPKVDNASFHISRCFNNISRKLWPWKILNIYNDLKAKNLQHRVNCIHAHSLFVNGLVAYLIFRKHKIRYYVTIRNTDVNTFMAKSFFFRRLGFLIMSNSDGVFTLSSVYFNTHLRKHYSEKCFSVLENKHKVLPNGAEDVWFENRYLRLVPNKQFNILFVGLLAVNKNLDIVIAACNKLTERGEYIKLSIIGDGRRYEYFKSLDYKFEVEFFGYVTDRLQLINIYRDADILCVPSFTESFGIVYIEAMTQSLPVIYTREQGFDGFFENGTVGYAVDPLDADEICSRIMDIKENYPGFSQIAYKHSIDFKWENTVSELLKCYKAHEE